MHADAPSTCENCATALQGRFCHLCGQAAANPLRHLGHAIEDFFESFWHLDGRVFRTLRDLFVPGRVARNYLAGQRARYIAPLRLFVVTTLLTFFLAGLAAQRDSEEPGQSHAEHATIMRANTVPAVRAALSVELAKIQLARDESRDLPGVEVALAEAESQLRQQAAARLAALGAPAEQVEAVRTPAADDAMTGGQGIVRLMTEHGGPRPDPDRTWDARTNPADVSWLPPVGDRWFNRRVANAARNVDTIQRDPAYAARLFLSALPTALFVLVPVFALLLKLLYLRSGWGYLEHLVVGLYSHVFLLLGVIALVLLGAVGNALAGIPALEMVGGALRTGVALGLPVYLLLMQKRVYRQGWGLTVLKYLVLGGIYVVLVAGAAVYAALAGLTSGG